MSELRKVRDKIAARRDELQGILERAGVAADESEAIDIYNECLRIIDIALQDERDRDGDATKLNDKVWERSR